ncbi:MAG: CBS domain-containing protein [Deltaproteobacteria bacterium]|nr:CBS domain-containing protein [Deltaproteobacteria bacterium]
MTPDLVCAGDVMTRELITVTPETPLLDVHRLFVEEEIHGAPVVGEDGTVYGLVTTTDLVRVVRDAEDNNERVDALTAADAMTPDPIMVPPDTSLEQLARTMVDLRIHRVFVGTDRMLEGVVSAFDVVRVVAGYSSESASRNAARSARSSFDMPRSPTR